LFILIAILVAGTVASDNLNIITYIQGGNINLSRKINFYLLKYRDDDNYGNSKLILD